MTTSPSTERDPAITLDELTAKLAAEFPEAFHADSSLSIMRIGYRVAHLRYAFRAASLRPGGTISGDDDWVVGRGVLPGRPRAVSSSEMSPTRCAI